MNKHLLTILIICLTFFAFGQQAQAQSNDLSIWTKVNSEKQLSVFPWGIHTTKNNLVLDYRYNFDKDNALGVFVGKATTISSSDKRNNLTIIPEIGVIYVNKGYTGLSPELQLSGNLGEVVLYTLTQYSRDLNEHDHFFYQYVEMGYDFSDFKLGLSLDHIFEYHPDINEATTKYGPYLTVPVSQNMYVKAQVNIYDKSGDFANTLLAIGFLF